MKDFMGKNIEGVNEMRSTSRKALDVGARMVEHADKISAVLKSIDLASLEDKKTMSDTNTEMHCSFDNAYNGKVENAGDAVEKQGRKIGSEVGGELKNVNDGIRKLEKAGSISDIGKNAAKTGQSKLESSGKKYEGILDDTEKIADETGRKINKQHKQLDASFKG